MKKLLEKKSIIVFIFLFGLGLPFIGSFFKIGQTYKLNENRQLAQQPHVILMFMNFDEFRKGFTRYYNDNFGFRSYLITLNYFFRYKLLKTSPSRQVIIGKDGWLFNAGEKEIESYLGFNNIPLYKLKIMALNFESKRKMLADRGIKYLFVISPNKSSIYPEKLPFVSKNVTSNHRTDDFIRFMKENTNADILDLRKPLIRHKETTLLYYKTDTHWNYSGALIGYQEIMNSVSKWFYTGKIQQLTDYKVASKKITAGDLALMIGGADFMHEEEIELLPLDSRIAMKVGDSNNPKAPELYIKQNSRLPRTIIFRDSFFDKLTPFASEHFQYSKQLKDRWRIETPIFDIINECRPDLIIEEVVEREL